MTRQPRFILPGQPQHVIQQGNNRQPIFATTRDYEFLFRDVVEGIQRA